MIRFSCRHLRKLSYGTCALDGAQSALPVSVARSAAAFAVGQHREVGFVEDMASVAADFRRVPCDGRRARQYVFSLRDELQMRRFDARPVPAAVIRDECRIIALTCEGEHQPRETVFASSDVSTGVTAR
nr:hypothetical protein [Rhodococcus sp. 06-1059B-a]